MRTRLIYFILGLMFFSAQIFAFGKKDGGGEALVVYAYDSFTAEWGAGAKIAEMFYEKTGVQVRFVTCEDGGSVLSKAVMEKNRSSADVLLGIDNNLLSKAVKAGILEPYKPKRANEIRPDLVMSEDWILTPFDFGYFAFMFNTESKAQPPKSLQDLTKPVYAKKIVIMDPRSSTPGLGLAGWTYAAFGAGYTGYWKKLKPNLLALTPGWSAGYSLFTSGEAWLVISYTTSLAAHLLYDNTEKFQPLIFSEGHVMQIEGMGLVKNSKRKEIAKKFIDFMLSDEAQSVLPETQFMFPVIESIPLPASFRKIPAPSKILKPDAGEVSLSVETITGILSE